jgi:hypothetical protein
VPRRIALALLGLLASLGLLTAGTVPAQAVNYGSIKIAVTDGSFTSMYVYRDSQSNGIEWVIPGDSTTWLYPVGVRVDTDPLGTSHSYRIKPTGTGASNDWGPCHENSDNHSSDPPQSTSGYSWVIYYKNYDDGYCNGHG